MKRNLRFLLALLSAIVMFSYSPATEQEAVDYEGARRSDNAEFLHLVCESNVQRTMQQIRSGSPILAEMEAQGAIKIVSAIYDMDTGKVSFLDQERAIQQ